MKKLFIAMLVSLGLAFSFGSTAIAASTSISGSRDQVCQGVNGQVGGTCDASGSGTDISRVIKAVLNILSWIAGIVAVFMIVIAGLKYITSGGDSSSIASAKQSLIYALVGVVIVALAQVIVRFVLGETV